MYPLAICDLSTCAQSVKPTGARSHVGTSQIARRKRRASRSDSPKQSLAGRVLFKHLRNRDDIHSPALHVVANWFLLRFRQVGRSQARKTERN